jgi:putative CocE/NonD family hydrolase
VDTTEHRLEINVPIPMRDGVELAADIWRPEHGEPVATLLARLPYGKQTMQANQYTSPGLLALLEAGYAVVVQDTRGTFRSEGTFVPHLDDANDGADTVTWLTQQDWCDGNIGSFGASYLGFVQWQTASTGVAGLKAMAPSVTSADLYRAPWHSRGGALSLDCLITWSTLMSANELQRELESGTGDTTDLPALGAAMGDSTVLTSTTPVAEQPLLAKYLPWVVEEAIGHPDRDASWENLSSLDRAGSITVPALNIGGWYDLFYGETLRAYTEMKKHGGSPEARDGQRLVMGPWSHTNLTALFPDRSFGFTAAAASIDLTATHLAFYDRWLRGREDALDRHDPVRIFVMGVDQWRDEQDWPLPDTTYTPYYLDGSGPANSTAGSGRLSTAEPTTDSTETYLYDPRRPVPSLGGTLLKMTEYDGAADQRPVQHRDDVLCFTNGVLDEPVEVTGPVSLTLFVSSSAVDTDFTAKLVDVHPDGRAIILCDGIQRMRYRNSLSEPELIEPGEVYEITVDLIATANVFLPGHQLLLEVSSSNFPRYDRNSNTGGVIATEHESDMVTAVNHVHRGPEYPSRLVLPIINR